MIAIKAILCLALMLSPLALSLAAAREAGLAAESAPTANDETPACTAIAHIGMQNVWRCDDEETGARCYINTTGMMFCLE